MKKMNKMIICAVMLLIAAMLCCGCAQTQPAANGSVAGEQGGSAALTLSHTVLELPLNGAIGQLHAFGAEDFDALEWFAEDSSVALVSGGRVTPMAEGSTVIHCTDGDHTASCVVTVSRTADMDYVLRLSAKQLSVNEGDAGRVEYTYTGPGAVAVFSSNPGVLRVENGCWKAIADGTAVITCTDGIKMTQCVVTVVESGHGA